MFSLTTLQQAPRDQGRVAVDLMLEHIADPGRARTRVEMKAKLVVRNSTSAWDPRQSAGTVDAGLRESRRNR